MNPHDKAHELTKSFEEMEEFRQLREVTRRIQSDPETLQMLQDFRKKQWMLETRELNQQDSNDEERHALEELAKAVQLNKDASTYLQLEHYFSNVLMDVYGIISKAVLGVTLPHPSLQLENEGGIVS